MGAKYEQTYNVVVNPRKAKTYKFDALLRVMPLGFPPKVIIPSKEIKALAEIEQDGYAMARVPSWKDAIE